MLPARRSEADRMIGKSIKLGAALTVLCGAVVVSTLSGGLAAAEDKLPFSLSTPGVSVPVAPLGGVAGYLLAEKSRLPYPSGVDRWVDARSDDPVTINVPGAGATLIQRQAALIYRPQNDRASWDSLGVLYEKAGILNPKAAPKLTLMKMPEGEAPKGNAFEDRIYETRTPGERLALGLIRNLQSQHLLVYQMTISSKMNDAQSLLYARSTVEGLAEEARVERMRLPGPPGSTSIGSVITLRGSQVRTLQNALTQDAAVSDEVKRMATVVLPQATSVSRTAYRTATHLSDKEFFDYYIAQARQRGYTAPISRDESHPGRPTLLFQRPYNSGVTLVRAQPTTNTIQGGLNPTTVYIFEMDGAINVDALTSK
jgi:hypothetical protein